MATKKTSTKATTYEAMIAVVCRTIGRDDLELRHSDRLDFVDLKVSMLETLIRRTFEAAYQAGLNDGYRQGRTDAAREAAGDPAPSEPRNTEMHD